jgi:hypothetical protein
MRIRTMTMRRWCIVGLASLAAHSMHPIVRSETGKGDAVSSGKRAEAGRESKRETLRHKEAGQGAALPEQGRGTHEGFDAKSMQAKAWAWNWGQCEDGMSARMKTRRWRMGSEVKTDESTMSTWARTYRRRSVLREETVTRIEERRSGATRLPAFDEARRGVHIRVREVSTFVLRQPTRGIQAVKEKWRQWCRQQDPRSKEKGSNSAESIET